MPIKRHYALIRIQKVREMMKANAKFECRYDLVGFGSDGSAKYTCVYLIKNDDGKMGEHILISERTTDIGLQERIFAMGVALLNHHRKFGDGTSICIDSDDIITTGRHRGLNEIGSEEGGEQRQG